MKKIVLGLLLVVISMAVYNMGMAQANASGTLTFLNMLCIAIQFIGAILTVMGIVQMRNQR